MPAKEIGKPCNCKNKCFDTVGLDNIKEIFIKYWNIGDNYEARSLYLMDRVSERGIKRRRGKDLARPDKKQWKYMVHCRREYEVCRIAFIDINGITDTKIWKVIYSLKMLLVVLL